MDEASILVNSLEESDADPAPFPPTDAVLSEVLAQLTEAVVTLTADGQVVSWNAGAVTLTGYRLADVNRKGFVMLFDRPHEVAAILDGARKGNPTCDVHLTLSRPDGQVVPVQMRCSPLRHTADTLGRVLVVIRDRSEIEALQQQLLQHERLNLLGRMAGALSHEIRNPLSAIYLHADILDDELRQVQGGDREQLRRSLAVIKSEVTQVHELVQQYLSLARLSDLPRQPVPIGSYVAAFFQARRDTLSTRQIDLRLELPPDLGEVALHASTFGRALLNLFNNAVEAMPDGGTLSVHGRRVSGRAVLDITDTGCGIASMHLPRLFSPFHTTKPDGTGLGLYLVREIVRAHAGQIGVRSEPGIGTTFTMTLPLASDVDGDGRNTPDTRG